MLFVISSSNNNPKTWTGVLLTSSWETSENIDAKLDKLVESTEESDDIVSGENQLDKEEKKWFFSFLGFGKEKNERDDSEKETKKNTKEKSETKEQDVNEVKESTKTWSNDQINEQGFFSKLFKWDSQDQENTESNTEESNDATLLVKESESEPAEIVNVRDALIGVWNGPDYSGVNIAKRTAGDQKRSYVDMAAKLPWVNLQTYVGKKYEIWVKALKLNNKTFSQTLWYMAEWDVVTQLSKANSYGCFEVQVEYSLKKGYVCKKYLRDAWFTDASNDQEEILVESQKEENSVDTRVHTAVWSYYRVVDPTDNINLNQGDILRQVSAPEVWSCTQMKIVGSNTEENTGTLVDICSTIGLNPMK